MDVCERCEQQHPNYEFGGTLGDRTCAQCGLFVHDGCPDPCIGYLPGVAFACCGHGNSGNGGWDPGGGYITFENGVTVRALSGMLVDGVTVHWRRHA